MNTERERVKARLAAIATEGADVRRGDERAIVPTNVEALAATIVENPGATIVAGATDVGLWVTKFLRPIGSGIFIGHLMKDVAVSEDEIRIGAGVTYSEFVPVVGKNLPEAEDYLLRVGGWQVRNAGTIGGNIANGSPIGETPPLLIALGARIVLRRGSERREIALEDFFIAYGKQDRAASEFVETVIILRPHGARIAAYKVSKRARMRIFPRSRLASSSARRVAGSRRRGSRSEAWPGRQNAPRGQKPRSKASPSRAKRSRPRRRRRLTTSRPSPTGAPAPTIAAWSRPISSAASGSNKPPTSSRSASVAQWRPDMKHDSIASGFALGRSAPLIRIRSTNPPSST